MSALTLPTPAELEAAERQLSDVILDSAVEGSIEEVCWRVFKAINPEKDELVDVTFEHIGSLVVFAHYLRDRGEKLLSLAGKIETAALVDLEGMRDAGGEQQCVPTYNYMGTPNVGKDGFLTPYAETHYFADMRKAAGDA